MIEPSTNCGLNETSKFNILIYLTLPAPCISGSCIKVGLARFKKIFAKLKLPAALFEKIPLFVWCLKLKINEF